MLLRREQVEDAVDRRRRAGGVDRAEHQVPGLGRVDGRLERLDVAQLADQDHVRVLADGVLEGLVPVAHVQADLALVDVRLAVGERELDRVLDGQDVQRLAVVDVVEHRGDRGRLAGPGDAGEDDHPFAKLHKLSMLGGRPRFSNVGIMLLTRRRDQRQAAALLEQGDAKPGLVFADDVREVDAAFLFENLAVIWPKVRQQQSAPCLPGSAAACRSCGCRRAAHHRRLADFQMQVGRLELHDHAEQLVDLRLLGQFRRKFCIGRHCYQFVGCRRHKRRSGLLG